MNKSEYLTALILSPESTWPTGKHINCGANGKYCVIFKGCYISSLYHSLSDINDNVICFCQINYTITLDPVRSVVVTFIMPLFSTCSVISAARGSLRISLKKIEHAY